MKKLLFLAALCFGFALPAISAATPAHVVVMIGEDEYHTWETLPEFVQKDLKPLGHKVTVIQADEKDKNNFPGLEAALRDANLLSSASAPHPGKTAVGRNSRVPCRR